MNAYTQFWLWWFTAFIGTFLVAESAALITGRPEDTLSANIWRLLDVIPGQPVWQWTAIHVLLGSLVFCVLVWLALHLVLGIWR
jgi:hypothetical protein